MAIRSDLVGNVNSVCAQHVKDSGAHTPYIACHLYPVLRFPFRLEPDGSAGLSLFFSSIFAFPFAFEPEIFFPRCVFGASVFLPVGATTASPFPFAFGLGTSSYTSSSSSLASCLLCVMI